MNIATFKIAGMTCEACVKLAGKRLRKISGVTEVNIDLATGKTEISSEAEIGLDSLTKSLEGTDYSIIK